jgi:copper chaperone CopZ
MIEQGDMVATSIFLIEGADRPGQVEKLKKTLEVMPGVRGIEINYLLDTAKVRYDPSKLSLARIKAAMQ